MADYRTWMLTGYRQSHTNGREGLQYFHVKGLQNHHYMNTWHNVDLKNWLHTTQSDHGAFDTSNGRYYCYTEGVIFSTATLMFTNPNTRDFHVGLYKNGSCIGITNEHSGGGNGNGHGWNGATISAMCRVAEGDYVSVRAMGNSASDCYLYGANSSSNYNTWDVFYIAGAQRDNPA